MTVPLKDLVNELAAWPSKEYAEDDSDDDWDNVIINLKEDQDYLLVLDAISDILSYYCEKHSSSETIAYKNHVVKAIQ